jgi:hypothetical protein
MVPKQVGPATRSLVLQAERFGLTLEEVEIAALWAISYDEAVADGADALTASDAADAMTDDLTWTPCEHCLIGQVKIEVVP